MDCAGCTEETQAEHWRDSRGGCRNRVMKSPVTRTCLVTGERRERANTPANEGGGNSGAFGAVE